VVDCDYCEREFALRVSTAFFDIVMGEGLYGRYQLDVGRVEMKLGGWLLDVRSQTNKTGADMSQDLHIFYVHFDLRSTHTRLPLL
jgi:hypothetical protein